MVQFEKGHWNLNELEIVEWIDTKTKGFLSYDVKTAVKKLRDGICLEDIEEGVSREEIQNRIEMRINKVFGFEI